MRRISGRWTFSLDAGQANHSAAYQLEFQARRGNVKIVGIEGGEKCRCSKSRRITTRKAMQQERVIIAAFSTETEAKLPKQKTRVASIHVLVSGEESPDYAVKLTVAAGHSRGNKIKAPQTQRLPKGNSG